MKNFSKFILATTILLTCANCTFADGNAFTPLNFDDTAYGVSSLRVSNAATNTVKSETTTGNLKMQNAITQLDNAQVEVRNELLNVKAKFADIDANYQTVKAERKAINKQIKSLERRINKIDKQKENIRKNMG